MKKDQFEAATVELWMTTSIPLTQANLQYHTGLTRRKVRQWVEELVSERVLDLDVDELGEVVYTVPGAVRASSGPRTFAEKERMEVLYQEVGGSSRGLGARMRAAIDERPSRKEPKLARGKRAKSGSSPDATMTALAIAQSARSELTRGTHQGNKSLLVSGGLSFAFGPLGWLYAGAFKETIPAAAGYLLLAAFLPSFLLLPLMGIVMPLSGIAGLIYAWQHNHNSQRTTLFTDSDDET